MNEKVIFSNTPEVQKSMELRYSDKGLLNVTEKPWINGVGHRIIDLHGNY